ncbi:MAG TPA: DNA-binding protein [Syntrophorhabdaceae bacterium]|nr:DNA-binding protein [Syntrophorhabdaceae bacterium]HPP06556.1 DNA-binding protein [Syntrophorhabdaceae bacterium]
MLFREYTITKIFQGRLSKGSDLIEDIMAFLKEKDIHSGIISGIGAASKATIGYYDQVNRIYKTKTFEEPLEILSIKGNISIKDHDVFPHIHGVFSRQDGSCIGGHVFGGTEVFAFEFEIIEFSGDAFIRCFDDETGLYLWAK